MVTPGSGGGSRKRTARHLAEALPQPTRLTLTKDLRITTNASGGFSATRAAYGASRDSATPGPQQGRTHPPWRGGAAQRRSRPALERTPGTLQAGVEAPRRRSSRHGTLRPRAPPVSRLLQSPVLGCSGAARAHLQEPAGTVGDTTHPSASSRAERHGSRRVQQAPAPPSAGEQRQPLRHHRGGCVTPGAATPGPQIMDRETSSRTATDSMSASRA